ncbi:MAG: DNA polymerase III subunit gamma/tau [Kosmotoga sp.]|nr:MAG: DNA polymerase III subunit gamma/tau [Kosmotoga sp.]
MGEVLYRKYRPLNFDELFGQNQVKDILKKALEKGKVSHAYIFYGPRGTGKTTTARILAKSLNCFSKDNKPCNECESCIAINRSNHMDVIELDAASNRGIDEIRKIRDAASYRPTMGKYKIYIIDEFHMLTREAFNGLLKTLEEPPDHVVFVLATTNLEKVPETILSRCQIFTFHELTTNEILNYLKSVLEREKKEYEDQALNIIAKASNGGMRDAINLLERVMVFSDEITEKVVRELLGIIPEDVVKSYLEALENADLDALNLVSEQVKKLGFSYEVMIEQAIDMLKDKIMKEKKDFNKIAQLVTELWEIKKELKIAEDKELAFDVLSLLKAKAISEKLKKTSFEKEDRAVKTITPETKEESKNVEGVEKEDSSESEQETTSPDKVGHFLDSLYNENRILDWVLLNIAEIELEDDIFKVSFKPRDSISHTMTKERFVLLEELVQEKLGMKFVLEDTLNKKNENRELLKKLAPKEKEYIERVISLFDDNNNIEIIEEDDNG